ncbi:MAG: type II secretion system protein GspG [Pseudomonadota bacterium]
MPALLAGCGTSPRQAQEAVIAELPRQRLVDFQNLETFPGNVVCGEWQGKSPDGEFRNFLPFIVIDGKADPEPALEAVNFYCNNDPRVWLYEKRGIAPLDPSNTALKQIRTELRALETALRAYYTDHSALPTTQDGLQSLLEASKSRKTDELAGPYLDAVPSDPWGQPYRYRNDSLGGVEPEYELKSLGRDNAPGGEYEDADVSIKDMDYIEHALSLR